MKKIYLSFLLCFSIVIIQAQKPYSYENLEKLSQEELNIYLEKALKKQKSGKIATIVGVCAVGGSLLTIPLDASGGFIAASAIFFVGLPGLVTTVVGISLISTGKKRVETIYRLKNTTFNKFHFNIKPSAQYNFVFQNYQPGVTVCIKF